MLGLVLVVDPVAVPVLVLERVPDLVADPVAGVPALVLGRVPVRAQEPVPGLPRHRRPKSGR